MAWRRKLAYLGWRRKRSGPVYRSYTPGTLKYQGVFSKKIRDIASRSSLYPILSTLLETALNDTRIVDGPLNCIQSIKSIRRIVRLSVYTNISFSFAKLLLHVISFSIAQIYWYFTHVVVWTSHITPQQMYQRKVKVTDFVQHEQKLDIAKFLPQTGRWGITCFTEVCECHQLCPEYRLKI